jgi:hypothetical protein
VTIAVAVVISVAALLYVFNLMQRARSANALADAPREKKKSRRERKLEKLREFDPLPEPKSMFEIMMEEAADLGVDEIAGGDGLETPVKLKVWRRDEAVRSACSGEIRYAISPGVEAPQATVDDVRLICVDSGDDEPTAAPDADTAAMPAADEGTADPERARAE